MDRNYAEQILVTCFKPHGEKAIKTIAHSFWVARQAPALYQLVNGCCTDENQSSMELGGLLHDIGRSKCPTRLLNYQNDLCQGDWEEIQRHPMYGVEILQQYGIEDTLIIDCCQSHHEMWNNSNGYPNHLRLERIPLAGRVIAVPDYYHARTNRPDQNGLIASHQQALREIIQKSRSHFDPNVVDAFLYLMTGQNQSQSHLAGKW